MPTATFRGVVIAESDRTVVVEGNHYFPPASVREWNTLLPSDLHTVCPWKGTASYYTIEAGGERAENAAWFYPEPHDDAAEIRDHLAFYGSMVDIAE